MFPKELEEFCKQSRRFHQQYPDVSGCLKPRSQPCDSAAQSTANISYIFSTKISHLELLFSQ